MTDDESKLCVDAVVESIPPLVLLTKENYRVNKDHMNETLVVQWELLMNIMDFAEWVLTPPHYDRLWAAVESALQELDAYMDEQDAAVPAEYLWTTEETAQFGVKGT